VTTPLAYNATAAQVAATLDALASVDNMTATGNTGGPWTVTFGGSQVGINVSRMGGDATAATIGTLVRTLRIEIHCRFSFVLAGLVKGSCHEPGNTSMFSAFFPAAEPGWEVEAVCMDMWIDEACAEFSSERMKNTLPTPRRLFFSYLRFLLRT
jgi:hypothetical protein